MIRPSRLLRRLSQQLVLMVDKEAANEADKEAAKEADKFKKKMIRGKRRCNGCGELGHDETSYKCRLNDTKKRQVHNTSL